MTKQSFASDDSNGLPWWLSGKESICNEEESTCNGNLPATSSVPGSRRSPGEGSGNTLQYCCCEIIWTEEPGGLLESARFCRIRQDLKTQQQEQNRQKKQKES